MVQSIKTLYKQVDAVIIYSNMCRCMCVQVYVVQVYVCAGVCVCRCMCMCFPLLYSWPLHMCWQPCVCTLCTECMEEYNVVLVVCTMDAAPIFNDVISEYICCWETMHPHETEVVTELKTPFESLLSFWASQ